jgi:uncharacterized membrane protein YqiK
VIIVVVVVIIIIIIIIIMAVVRFEGLSEQLYTVAGPWLGSVVHRTGGGSDSSDGSRHTHLQ